MAKLNGVKVIDMENGDVTKISYEDAEYEKVDGGITRHGDILLRVRGDAPWAAVGNYYLAIDDGGTYKHFIDDGGDTCGIHDNLGNFDIFRKLSVNSSTHEERISTLEVKVEALEKLPESLVGKYVIFTDTDGADLTAGKAYEIKYEYGDYLDIIDDTGETQTVRKDEQNSRFAYEIADEIPELQVGDKVKPVIADGKEPEYKWGSVRNGDIGEVVDTSRDEYVIVNFPKQTAWKALREELVITNEEVAVFSYGEYAKVVGETLCDGFKEGTIVKVVSDGVDSDGEYNIESLDEVTSDYAEPSALEKVELSESDLLFVKNGREIGEFKVGDIAEVLVSPYAHPVGSLVEVTQLKDCDGDYKAKGVCPEKGDVCQEKYYKPHYLKLVALAENRVDSVA